MYPTWKYHATAGALLVQSLEEEEALGAGWADSPAAFGVITAPSVDEKRQRLLAMLHPAALAEDDALSEATPEKKGRK